MLAMLPASAPHDSTADRQVQQRDCQAEACIPRTCKRAELDAKCRRCMLAQDRNTKFVGRPLLLATYGISEPILWNLGIRIRSAQRRGAPLVTFVTDDDMRHTC